MKTLQMTVFTVLLAISTLATSQTIKDYIVNEWPDSRYTVHGDGTVTDTETGLMWQQCSQGQSGEQCAGTTYAVNWRDALNVAATENFAGHTDWRVPNRNELLSLVALDRFEPAINVSIFPNTPGDSQVNIVDSIFWSASPYPQDVNAAWTVYFNYGTDFYNYRTASRQLRLVRGGQ